MLPCSAFGRSTVSAFRNKGCVMEDSRVIQWFPGHMTRTKRRITEQLPQVDAVVEVVDARIPIASRNPDLDGLIGNKPRLIILNKADMADEPVTRRWVAHFSQNGIKCLVTDSKSGRGVDKVVPALRELLDSVIQGWASRGMSNRAIRVMVVGIPNSGKSSFINRLAGVGRAKVEDRPGVTRENQWYAVGDGVQLLDTPGVLWPKFDDQTVAKHLAFTGAISDRILDREELACELLVILRDMYRDRLCERFKLSDDLPETGWELLELIGRKRGMLMARGEVNTERAADTVLDEYRSGKFGRISLEMPAR